MIIIFRACEKQATISNVTRQGNFDKTTILRKCWLSLQQSVSKDDHIILIEDQVSEATLDWLDLNNKAKLTIVHVPDHEWKDHKHTAIAIEELIKSSKQNPDELHYMCEDDYLHVPNAIEILKATLNKWHGFALSYDYIDRYKNPEPCQVLLGLDRHWRTVTSSTMTVLALGSTWLKIENQLREMAPLSNDKIFDDIFKDISCISPLPSLSCHLTEHHTSPFIDWAAVWELYK